MSAHYLVGRSGQKALILPPEFRAWHAGNAVLEFNNARSIGIECHHAVGDSWWSIQKDALKEVVEYLMQEYNIPTHMIETHRKIALPEGRKEDPSDWSDLLFYHWRSQLMPGVSAVFRNAFNKSGGVWKPNQLTPGHPKSSTFEYQGKLRQRFERGVATLEEDGSISWMLLEEVQNANFPV